MNTANVTERFLALSGAEASQLGRWRGVIEDACDYVEAHCAVPSPDAAQTRALELLAAAYAYKLFDICGDDRLSSFAAGDVRVTSSARGGRDAQTLWRELCREYASLLDTKGFLFGRIVMS